MSMIMDTLEYKNRRFTISFGDALGERYYRFKVVQDLFNKDNEKVGDFVLIDCSQEMYKAITGCNYYDMKGMKEYIMKFVDSLIFARELREKYNIE